MIKKIILLFLVWKISIFTVTSVFIPVIADDFVFVPREHRFYTPIQSNDLIRRFANFDGMSYLKIARDGYFSSELGYFPLYPILIKFFSQIPLTFFNHRFYVITAEVLSNIAFMLSLIVMYKIMRQDKIQNIFTLLVFVVLLYPTSFYFGAAYNDSLFLLFATLTLYLSRKKRWILASIFGGLATLTRLNGLALVFLILGEYVIQTNGNKKLFAKKFVYQTWISAIKRSFSFKKMMKEKIIGVLLVPIAFIAYLAYINIQFGSFYTLFSSMDRWGQDRIIFPPQVIWRYIKIIFLYPTFKLNYWIAVLETSSVALYCFATVKKEAS